MIDTPSDIETRDAAADGAAASPASPVAGALRFVVRDDHDEESLAAATADWEMLAENALEPSPSSEAWMLAPSIRYLTLGTDVRVVTIHSVDAARSAEAELCAIFVMELRTRFGVPRVRTLRLWDHMYSLSSAPLLHRDRGSECLRALFRWVAERWPARTLIEFPGLRADGAFCNALLDFVRQDRVEHMISDLGSRAFFRPGSDVEEYLDSIGTKHAHKEWRRCERRLSEMGNLEYQMLGAGGNASEWVDEFIALEMRGWKGREGTAFGCNREHRAWLSEVVAAAQRRGQLMALALRLDGKPVAMKLNFICPPGGYTFKIAFDENFGKFTPGTLLELENIRRLHDRPDVAWVDSLATSNHPMINRVWRDRSSFTTVLAAPRRTSSEIVVTLLPLLRLARKWWQRAR